ncbi:MAG TPA: ROK family protein [Candidatus Angelobacter sp.]|nr:ROK family protein [Candidatus Angelobacter sp.]
MPAFSIGVDLGGTNLRIAAIDTNGAQMEVISVPSHVDHGREEVITKLTAHVRTLIHKYSSAGRFLGLGIGVPGIIDLETGTIHSAANLPGWQGYAARSDLESKLQVPVILENDANCAALGEKWLGAGRGVEDLCMITLGTGVGGGFVFTGKPWHGVLGMAGEIGHTTVIPEGRPCNCGNHGCLEQYASATAIRQAALEYLNHGKSPCLSAAAERDPQLSARTVHACAQAGDVAAKEIFEMVGKAIGIALANLINSFNLPMYVIGGGVSRAWDQFSPAMFRELNERSIVYRAGEEQKLRHRSTEIKPAELQDRAGLLGAARLPVITSSACCCSLAV